MKKLLLSIILVSMFLLTLGLASACGYGDHHDCDLTGKTSIEGKIVYPSSEDKPETITVTVTCTHNGQVTSKETEAESLKGKKITFKYFVEFTSNECGIGDTVTVNSVDDNGWVGTGEGIVRYDRERHNLRSYNVRGCHKLDLKLKIRNIVPTVPEFGLLAGALTIFGAAGTFFIVRRK
jgi:hypothetical protein